MRLRNKLLLGFTLLAVFLLSSASSCDSNTAADKASRKSDQLQHEIYQVKHDTEFKNYNLRLRIADDPATILWCTFFPPGVQGTSNGSTPGQAFTVPIAGKLTSSGKRPYRDVDGDGFERPAPDHMFGPSSEYRYGFDPTRAVYYDFTSLASFCTTQPTIWQAQNTKLNVAVDGQLASITAAAEAAIRDGKPSKAYAILKSAKDRKP